MYTFTLEQDPSGVRLFLDFELPTSACLDGYWLHICKLVAGGMQFIRESLTSRWLSQDECPRQGR